MELHEAPDDNPQFETYGVVPNEPHERIHHDRISKKYTDETQTELESVAIQPFVDEETPHGRMGVQIDPDHLDDVINYLEIIQMEIR